jgi:hypothetical protein
VRVIRLSSDAKEIAGRLEPWFLLSPPGISTNDQGYCPAVPLRK